MPHQIPERRSDFCLPAIDINSSACLQRQAAVFHELRSPTVLLQTHSRTAQPDFIVAYSVCQSAMG